MALLRVLFLCLLAVALAPWGAYARLSATADVPRTAGAMAAVPATSGAEMALPGSAPEIRSALRCHGPSLAGSTCDHDRALAPMPKMPAPDARRHVLRPARAPAPSEPVLALSLPPPRRV